MAEYHLESPLSEQDVRVLRIGDIVYLSGLIYTVRDEAHMHILKAIREGRKIEVNLEGSAIFHCGPIMKRDKEKWHVVVAGPTTSSRMNTLEPEFIEKMAIRAIVGKGGMSKPTIDAMAKFGCVYLSITGGAAALAANGIKEVKGVYLEQLGMPEAIWILEAKNLGPLIVGIDTNGESLFERISQEVEKNLPKVKEKLRI